MTGEPLGADRLERFYAVADLIIPSSGTMPSASAADPRTTRLRRLLTGYPDLELQLRDVLVYEPELTPAEYLEALHATHKEWFRFLLSICHMVYYLNPRVQRRLGYPGQAPARELEDELELLLAEADLDVVKQRGAIYRNAGEIR